METSAIAASKSAASSAQATTRGLTDIDSGDFFQMLITQLQTQDPLKPMDNQQLMSQLSTIRQMEQSTTLNTTLQALAAEQRFGATAGLIGHYVAGTVTSASGQSYELQGLVIGVRFDSKGQAILELHNGASLPASKVEQVTVVENLPADIRQQLEEELAQMNGTDGSSETAARAILAGNQVAGSTGKLDAAKNPVGMLIASGFGARQV